MTPRAKKLAALLVCVTSAAIAVPGGETLLDTLLQRPTGAKDTVIVPDRFLRRWDPVTIFFEDNEVDAPGAVDGPGKYATLDPPWPGAWTWLDRRTLQFKPADPWPPLRRFTVRADGEEARVATLMTPPSRTVPRDGADGLEPIETITLTFPAPVPLDALADMVTIELRALPGLGDGPVQRLGAGDFTVKALQRPNADAPAEYMLTLRRPIPAGMAVTLRFLLSLDDGAEAVSAVRFETARPFGVESVGCRGGELPVGPAGARYAREQPLRCRGERRLYVEFTGDLPAWGPIEGRSLVRFEPAVDGLEFRAAGRRLQMRGDFERETPYRMTVMPAPVKDRLDRPLELRGEASAWLYFPRESDYLRWTSSHGVAEAGGPVRVPLVGRGHGRADLRIHRVDPYERSFWPFGGSVINTDESTRPPGPGEMPERWTDTDRISRGELTARLAALGSPGVSTLVELPLRPAGDAATFGLDLAPHLRTIAGSDAPGHYLVGLRLLDGSTRRSWMRLQVTDLSLTTVESPTETLFVVTSLSTGEPVSKVSVKVEGVESDKQGKRWVTLYEGRTDRRGQVEWKAPGPKDNTRFDVRRISATKGRDVLVLDAAEPPERFADDHWRRDRSTWLGWMFQTIRPAETPKKVCHVFTERPLYRPEHVVHVRGWLRTRYQGALTPIEGLAGRVEIRGPGEASWRMPVTTSETGGFYAKWDEAAPPTGVYEALFFDDKDAIVCRAGFEVEAYRLPTFEVELLADDEVPLDRAFAARLVASPFAGGQLVDAPVNWRVTQFPYTWTPKARPGYVYSSDGRYSRTRRFESRPAIVQSGRTDARGSAAIELDPSVEVTGSPRTYVIEATVTGEDDQTVTAVERVHAVPAFALGLKLPRYLPTADVIAPEIIAAGPDGALVEGVEITATLKRRAWHAHLQASDFSRGEARYVTDIVDEVVTTATLITGKAPVSHAFNIDKAGVYLVELEARDRLGRAQVVTVDLYAGGAGAVAWDKPKAGTFGLSSNRDEHEPGQTAQVVVQSPYQKAEALVIIETPTGNRYRWLPVRDGKASFGLEIERTWTPRLPVHVVLMRGRVEAATPSKETAQDLGKPITAAATLWLDIAPVGNRVDVKLTHPETAVPGEEVPVTIELREPSGKPRGGEVTLWLVDKAVLSLADEARLDPVPDYITPVDTHVGVHDTRNLGFGRIPFAEMPGGGDGDDDDEGALDKLTVRDDFRPVPYYEAALRVPSSGKLTVKVALPDNLTIFAIRAKAAVGPDRFGAGKSELPVRLPLLVQPALPRFVRIGDRFTAAAVGRIVEGDGGAGDARLKTTGLEIGSEPTVDVTWDLLRARRFGWPVTAPTPALDANGEPERDTVRVEVAALRKADGVGDAFAIDLPLLPDRAPVFSRRVIDLEPGAPVELTPPTEAARPGSLRRTLVLSTRPALVKMAGALDTLTRHPDGNTEQRVSRARALLASKVLREAVMPEQSTALADRAVEDTLRWLPLATDPHGLIAQWPGSTGRVWLTAWAAHFVADATEAGYTVDPKLTAGLAKALRAALASDYERFISGERWAERVMALDGLAHLQELDRAYFAELARNAQYLGYGGLSSVVLAGSREPEATDPALYGRLVDTLAAGITVRLYEGREIYSGIRDRRESRNPLILPSEIKTLAEMTRALIAAPYQGDRLPLMVDALVRLGAGDGWGSTAADAPALLALTAWLEQTTDVKPATFNLTAQGAAPTTVTVGTGRTIDRVVQLGAPATTLLLQTGGADEAVALEIIRYVPEAPAIDAPAVSDGFVVSRAWHRPVEDGPPLKTAIEGPGQTLDVQVGDVVEEHIQIVNPSDRHYVAITAPLAAGLEPLNPRLATAPPEAAPLGQLTTPPTFVQYLDDRVVWHYETLPKGTHDFYYRVRATVDGTFGQPPATAEMSYDRTVRGRSPGAAVTVQPKP